MELYARLVEVSRGLNEFERAVGLRVHKQASHLS
jgi:hypothetical protein